MKPYYIYVKDNPPREIAPWTEGYIARYECKDRITNPYIETHHTKDAKEWDEGFYFADQEMKQ